MLRAAGIRKIEKILIDKWGNCYIKDYDRLLLVNLQAGIIKTLFPSYVMKNATIGLHNNMLIAVGNYGVLYSRIVGKGQVLSPLLASNVKNIAYSNVEGWQVAGDELLLKTDNGLLETPIPSGSALNGQPDNESAPFFKLIVDYNGQVLDMSTTDTIAILQTQSVLQLDAINPLGSGNVQYFYQLNDNWVSLNANEIHLPNLSADHYYDLAIQMQDNSSRSRIIHIILYIIPYWWQTVWGKRFLYFAGLLLIVIIIYLTVYITRRSTIRKNNKQNQLMELELKSLYAQINPHFIFNTLTSVQLSIQKRQMDTAYVQVNKFSKLLRSYIDSSRNKFTMIDEEIANLRNYIELQQTRFKNRFTYEIIKDEDSDIGRIMIPSLLVQPLVENAINHGLFHKKEKGYLRIEFRKAPTGEIICTIEDNGIGRQQSKVINDGNPVKPRSYGSELTKELIDIFKLYEKMNIEMRYIDKQLPETGTIVELKIKSNLYG